MLSTISDQREGYGVYECSTGSTYRGSWKNDKMHGYGQYSDNTAEQIHDGGWRKGRQRGYALVYATNSSKKKADAVLLTGFDQGKNVADSSFEYTFAMWRIFQAVHSLGHDKLSPVVAPERLKKDASQ
jgi:hypothetical protein